jgi:multimeric flavodoxin WrbA
MQRVRLLGLCGSPRRRGNSHYLLERALAGASYAAPGLVESELYQIAGREIAPCLSCYRCRDGGDCAIKDDFQALRDKWIAADAIIYSVPVYHMAIPAQLKCFIDRLGNTLFSYYRGALGKNLKTVGVVVQGSHIFAGQEQVITYLTNHAVLMGCIPVAGDPWQSYIGAAGWTRCSTEDGRLRVLSDEGEPDAVAAVSAAEALGKRVVQVALVIKSGGMACRDMLRRDGGYDTFLSRLASGGYGGRQED